MNNGGFLGIRREPNSVEASGVWNVQDAYTAYRDRVWPQWPGNTGMVLDPGLLLWLEADYGLYSDVDATVPATADGAEVRSWVNRGSAGLVRFEPANNPMLLRLNNGDPYLELNSALAQILPVRGKSNNYLWIKSRQFVSSSFRFLESVDLGTGVEGARYRHESGATALWPINLNGSVSRTPSSTYAESGELFASWRAREVPWSTTFALGSAIAQEGGGFRNPSGSTSVLDTVEGIDFPIGIRAVNSASLLRNGKIKALVWYSTDTPLTPQDVDSISKYLGDKWGYNFITGSFG